MPLCVIIAGTVQGAKTKNNVSLLAMFSNRFSFNQASEETCIGTMEKSVDEKPWIRRIIVSTTKFVAAECPEISVNYSEDEL